MTQPERSSSEGLIEFLSKTVTMPTSFAMVLSHPHRKSNISSHYEEQEEENGPLVVIPHVTGMGENIRHVCKELNIRVAFKSRQTLPQYWQGSRIHYLWVNNPMWYIISPATVASLQLERLDGD